MGFGFDFIKYKMSACLLHVQQNNHRASFVFGSTTDLQKMPLRKLSFCISYFSKTNSNPTQKNQSNASQVKRSPQRLEINTRKLAKSEWFWQAASEKNIH